MRRPVTLSGKWGELLNRYFNQLEMSYMGDMPLINDTVQYIGCLFM